MMESLPQYRKTIAIRADSFLTYNSNIQWLQGYENKDTVSTPNNNNLKNKFTIHEDERLLKLVQENGNKNWGMISKLMGTRNPRQCRERWNNYLNPELRKDKWSPEEDELLDEKYAEYGPKWNKIAKFFVHRSDNSIRNRWMMLERHRLKAKSLQASKIRSEESFVKMQLPIPLIKMPQSISNEKKEQSNRFVSKLDESEENEQIVQEIFQSFEKRMMFGTSLAFALDHNFNLFSEDEFEKWESLSF